MSPIFATLELSDLEKVLRKSNDQNLEIFFQNQKTGFHN